VVAQGGDGPSKETTMVWSEETAMQIQRASAWTTWWLWTRSGLSPLKGLFLFFSDYHSRFINSEIGHNEAYYYCSFHRQRVKLTAKVIFYTRSVLMNFVKQ
jgi:hypothetical protein